MNEYVYYVVGIVVALGVLAYVLYSTSDNSVETPVDSPKTVDKGPAVEHPLTPVVKTMLDSADNHLKQAQEADTAKETDKASEHYVQALNLQQGAQKVLEHIVQDQKSPNSGIIDSN